MSVLINENELPQELTAEQAVEVAYASELAEVASKLQRGLPTLIECDKELGPFLYLNVRNRLRPHNLRCLYLDGRPRQDEQPGAMPMGMIGTMIAQLREAVRGAVERRVVVLPHLDLLTTSQGGLTSEAREVIPLLYENPELVWLGFKDPSFPLPQVIENLFPHRISLLGLSRTRLRHLICRRESRKFGRDLNPWSLYKYVSGINAVRLRRLLSTLEGEDYPANPGNAYRQLRQATLARGLTVPDEGLEDVGGYEAVKKRLHDEVLDLLGRIDRAASQAEGERLEELLPRGILFTGPSGVGKRLLALARAVGAAMLETTAAELKSRFVGASEENVRHLFWRARQAAPAVILFRAISSFAGPPERPTGPVEPSMLQQLQQEMEALPRGELVLVMGTAASRHEVDPPLLRPGRFELILEVGPPSADDRREVLRLLDRRLGLELTPEALERAVQLTAGGLDTPPAYGERLQALGRALARLRVRTGQTGPTQPADVEETLAWL